MRQRVITGILLAAIGLPAVYFGGVLLKVLLALITLLGIYEFVSCRQKGFNLILYLIDLIFVLLLVFTDTRFYFVEIFSLLIGLFVMAIASEDFTLEDIGMQFFFSILFGFSIVGILRIYEYGSLLMFFVLIAALVCDAGAYFTGYFLGRHKLNERISPNKTIEGAIGGWIIGGALAFAYANIVLMPYDWFSVNFYLIASILLPVMGIIGDLAFSLIKRQFGIKDFGTIFPGHGGILDRFDSMLFCLLVFEGLMMTVNII